MLQAVGRKPLGRGAMSLLGPLDDLDEVVHAQLAVIELDDCAARHRVDYRPPHAVQLGKLVLHLAGQVGVLWPMHALDLDVRAAVACPLAALVASRRPRQPVRERRNPQSRNDAHVSLREEVARSTQAIRNTTAWRAGRGSAYPSELPRGTRQEAAPQRSAAGVTGLSCYPLAGRRRLRGCV